MENRAMGRISGHPHSSAMRFDDRVADRQAHPHTAGLRRVEGLEDAVEFVRSQSRPGILDVHQNGVRLNPSGGNDHVSGSDRALVKRLDGIDNQI